MSLLVALAALVIHTYDGQDRVVSDIEPFACEESRCHILFGDKSCGAALAEGVHDVRIRQKAEADQLAWEKANPKTYAHCFPRSVSIYGMTADGTYCGPRYGSGVVTMSSVQSIPSGATKSVMCIRQRGDRP